MSKVIYLSVLLLISLYLVVGGIANIMINKKFEAARELPHSPVSDTNGGEYWNINEMEAYEEYDKMAEFYPSYRVIGSTMQYLLNLMAFGILGSVIRILLKKIGDPTYSIDNNIFITPVLGGLIGIVAIILSEVLPEFKAQSGNDKFFYSVAVFGGIYSKEFFVWLESKFKTIFQTGNAPAQS